MALREGQWKVVGRVVHSVLGMTQTGKQQIAVTFEYEEERQTKRMVTWYGFFTDAALPFTVEALQALGWDPSAHDWNIGTIDGTDTLIGREAALVLEEEEYEGRLRTKVRFVNPLGGLGVERMEAGAAKAFATDLRKRLMGVAPPGTPKVGSAAPAASGRAASPGQPATAGATASASRKAGDGDIDLASIPF